MSDKVTYLAVQDSYKDKQEDFALAVQYASMAGNQLQIISRFNIECHCFENIKTQYWLFVCNYASH